MVMLRTLFLNPPSFERFDGGTSARSPFRLAVRSFWYPTCLAQAAALIPNSKLIDAPADDLSLDEVLRRARGFELCVIHASTPSFTSDANAAAALKAQNPEMRIGMVGPHVAFLPEESLKAAPALDFAARDGYLFAIKEIAEGRPYESVLGVSHRSGAYVLHTSDRPRNEDLSALPSIYDVFKRDLTPAHYSIRFLKHPYLSLDAGVGCQARCSSFFSWPPAPSHRAHSKSVSVVIAQAAKAHAQFPDAVEFFVDDDAFMADLERATEIARGLGALAISWSCSAQPNIPLEFLKIFKDNGLRVMQVVYTTGDQRILNKFATGKLDDAREFTQNCHDLGIAIHGTFIVGLPGETRESVEESIRYACALDIDTIQVATVSPDPEMSLHQAGTTQTWFDKALLIKKGAGGPPAVVSRLSDGEIQAQARRFYLKFYARPTPIVRMLLKLARTPNERRRLYREGKELIAYLRRPAKRASETTPRRASPPSEKIPS